MTAVNNILPLNLFLFKEFLEILHIGTNSSAAKCFAIPSDETLEIWFCPCCLGARLNAEALFYLGPSEMIYLDEYAMVERLPKNDH